MQKKLISIYDLERKRSSDRSVVTEKLDYGDSRQVLKEIFGTVVSEYPPKHVPANQFKILAAPLIIYTYNTLPDKPRTHITIKNPQLSLTWEQNHADGPVYLTKIAMRHIIDISTLESNPRKTAVEVLSCYVAKPQIQNENNIDLTIILVTLQFRSEAPPAAPASRLMEGLGEESLRKVDEEASGKRRRKNSYQSPASMDRNAPSTSLAQEGSDPSRQEKHGGSMDLRWGGGGRRGRSGGSAISVSNAAATGGGGGRRSPERASIVHISHVDPIHNENYMTGRFVLIRPLEVEVPKSRH
ncbi:hypothetical protein O6H91_07G018000 [Diphasiastrum complanatum]|uniref:Uncharacterized protein n=1 Tax=Diphasiastrum complanatum TaxID=34168 RepID=A0ACC2D3Q4_DIPCM|nr:hypothetical protein O6H91_07G018000 [Diphasiastrum complanatum]